MESRLLVFKGHKIERSRVRLFFFLMMGSISISLLLLTCFVDPLFVWWIDSKKLCVLWQIRWGEFYWVAERNVIILFSETHVMQEGRIWLPRDLTRYVVREREKGEQSTSAIDPRERERWAPHSILYAPFDTVRPIRYCTSHSILYAPFDNLSKNGSVEISHFFNHSISGSRLKNKLTHWFLILGFLICSITIRISKNPYDPLRSYHKYWLPPIMSSPSKNNPPPPENGREPKPKHVSPSKQRYQARRKKEFQERKKKESLERKRNDFLEDSKVGDGIGSACQKIG